jgi:hypothetical protein
VAKQRLISAAVFSTVLNAAPAAVIGWCAGSCWCTAPHPLCVKPGVCPGVLLGLLIGAGWATSVIVVVTQGYVGLRPVWLTLLRGIGRQRA